MTAETSSLKQFPKTILAPEQLRWHCPLEYLEFETTKDVEPLQGIVGQEKAIDAIEMGAQIQSHGYNMFVSGISGTGRLTTVKRLLGKIAKNKPNLCDFCYVHNFKSPDSPRLLRFKAGRGKKFHKAMEEAMLFLRRRIPQLFDEDSFQSKRREMVSEYQKNEQQLLSEFNAKIQPSGFVLGQLQLEDGTITSEIFPVINGEPVQITELDELVVEKKLTKKQVETYKKKYLQFKAELIELARTGVKQLNEFRKTLLEFDKTSVGVIVSTLFEDLKIQFPENDVKEYFEEIKADILSHLQIFVAHSGQLDTERGTELTPEEIQEKFLRYSVNLLIDNSHQQQIPIIVETSPSFSNLFGTIEKKYDASGFWKTDFTQIKAGSLFRADQGFLVINALDLLREQGVWAALKRFLLYGKLEIQSVDSYIQMSQTMLKPQPVDLNVKVIMIGDAEIYHALYFSEEDFKKIFKINAEFDYEATKSREMIMNYAKFMKKLCEQEQLLHFNRSGVARVIEWAVEHTESQNKITLQFSDVADVMREASFFAQKNKAKVVTGEYVDFALEARRFRNDIYDAKIKEKIIDGSVLIATTGTRVGQINGLTVYDTGLVSFGKPARITVTVGVGSTDIVSIEREVEMSGSIHDKGIMTITGLMREKFAQKRPLTLSASVAFEQNYGGIDGDSASAAEVIALFSALSNIAVRQDIAITGSVNQKGDIQPIGGVNEKITGFFEICQERGLTGTQGVVIPIQNIHDLMLPTKVIDAVKQGLFFISPVATIDEAAEIMLDYPTGAAATEENPQYLYSIIDKRLEELHLAAESEPKDEKKKKKKRKKRDQATAD